MKPRRGQRRGVRLLAALTLLMVGSGVTPFVTAPTPFAVEEARAADATITDCSAATGFVTFSDTLDAVQADGGGTITFNCAETITFTTQKEITADVTIIGNGVGFNGGGHRLFRINSGTSLNLQNLKVENGKAAGFGGAIFNDRGTLTITASTFSGNSTDGEGGDGGAIVNDDGTMTITASTFIGNSTSGEDGNGGAIYNSGALEITASSFISNSTNGEAGFGGAIYNSGTLEILTSTFSDNSTTGIGGFGGAIYNSGTLEIMASTFSGNSMSTESSIGGGAIFHFHSTLEITSSTFSENTSSAGGAAFHLGANTNTRITASTISGNTAPGGGAAIVLWGALTIESTIVAENTNGNCKAIPIGSFTSNGSNLSDDTSCNLTDTSDIQSSTDINLGALANNGGPTQTMLPQADSDAIDNANCALSSTEDQRGLTRPTSGTICTIGAVEVTVLCASRSTGALSVPGDDGCGPHERALVLPGEESLTHCIRRRSGAVSVRNSCPPSWNQHIVPDHGPFEYCASRHTGALRAMPASGCASNERPGVIPG